MALKRLLPKNKAVGVAFSIPLIVTAVIYEFWQFIFTLFAILATAVTELPFYIGEILTFLGGGYIALGFAIITIIIGILGYAHCGIFLALNSGAKNAFWGERGSGFALFVICLALDLAPFLNGFFPGLILWTWYVSRSKE